jgi:long-chain acyl-CoA synthetase
MIWLQHYPAGVPANINADKYTTLIAIVEEAMTKYADRSAFANMGVSMTFGELDKLSRDFAAYLISRGLEPGDKIALMMPNLLQYPVALYGALRAGLVVVNTNPLYTPREMEHQFTDAGVKAIVIAENFAANLEQIIDKTQIKTVIVTSLGEMLGGFKGMMVNLAVRYVKRMVPTFNLKNTVTMQEALDGGKKFDLPKWTANAQDTIFLQYTGGTTGVSKGAELTNRNMIANMIQMKAVIEPSAASIVGQPIALSPLPLYHIFACTVNAFGLFTLGFCSVLVTNPRDLPSVLKEFGRYKISLMTGVNTLFNGLLNHKDFAKTNFSDLKIVVAGAMAVQKAVNDRWLAATNVPITEGYGMTESSPVLSVNPLDGGKIGTIGLPVPSTEMRIADENDNPLPQGEIGEIQARGPQIMKGYYNQAEETAKTIRNGWLCTGDIGLMDEQGYFKIVDRLKDMILVSGFNVYPNEIEDVAVAHPKVLEAAAVGIADANSGEAVKLFIVKKDDSLTESELKAYMRENLTAYKNPKQIVFRSELPKTPVGKVLRRMLRDEA